MKQFLKYTIPGFLLLSIIVACEKEYESIEVIDDRNVSAYIQQNNLSSMQEYEDSGIFYQILTPGSGPDLEYSEQVPLILTSKSLDNKYVSLDTFSLGNGGLPNRMYNFLGYLHPEAMRIGVKEILKKRSGSIRLIVPSRLAFGRNGGGNIPGNASLDLTIKVLDKDKMKEYEDFNIQKYLTSNSLSGFTKTSTGIYYKITEPGSGSPITTDSTITAEYTGRFLNGVVFEKTAVGSPATFVLTGAESVIDGWKQTIPLIKQGGSIRMILPSSQAYGLAGTDGGIPPFSCLDFDVKVTDVSP